MKFLTTIALAALLTYTSYLYSDVVPWWSFAFGVFLVGLLIPQQPWKGWVSGFLGVFLCWLTLAWYMDDANSSILSTRMAAILPLGGSPIAIILVTALIGALIGGFANLSGLLFRKRPQ